MPSADMLWHWAIAQWIEEGRADRLNDLLLQDRQIPSFARAWMAQALAGKVKRKAGRKPSAARELTAKEAFDQITKEQSIRETFAAVSAIEAQATAAQRARGDVPARDGSPSDKALAFCAERFGMSVGNVKRVVYPESAKAARKGARPQT